MLHCSVKCQTNSMFETYPMEMDPIKDLENVKLAHSKSALIFESNDQELEQSEQKIRNQNQYRK